MYEDLEIAIKQKENDDSMALEMKSSIIAKANVDNTGARPKYNTTNVSARDLTRLEPVERHGKNTKQGSLRDPQSAWGGRTNW